MTLGEAHEREREQRDRATTATPTCMGNHCITCADEGVPMTVLDIDADTGLARCAGNDLGLHDVELGLVDGATPGAIVLVHADVAIALLEAAR